MAKKTDDFELDDFDFDFDEFDNLGEGGWKDLDKKTKARKAVSSLSGGFVKGVKEKIFSRDGQRAFIENGLPKSYASAYDSAIDGMDAVEELYDSAKSELDKVSAGAAHRMKPLIDQYEKKLPLRLRNPLKKWAMKPVKSNQWTEENNEELQAVATVNEIFANKETANAARISAAQAKVQTGLVKNQTTLLTNILKANKEASAYRQNVDAIFKRKTLELQYRQFYVQRKILESNQQMLKMQHAAFDKLVKNTALPDFVKMKRSEVGKEMFMKQMFGDAIEEWGKIPSNLIRNASKNLKANVTRKIKEQGDELFSLLDSLSDAGGATEEMDPTAKMQMAAALLGNHAGGKALTYLGKKFGKRFANNKRINSAGTKLNLLKSTAGKELVTMIKNGTGNNFIDGLLDLMGAREMYKGPQTSIRKSEIDNLEEPAIYDQLSRKALTEIIPTYLAKIHWETKALRTGNTSHSKELYDFSKGKWSTVKTIKNEMRKQVKEQAKAYNQISNSYSGKLGTHALGKDLQKVVHKAIMTRGLDGSSFSFSELMNENSYESYGLSGSEKQEVVSWLISLGFRPAAFNTPLDKVMYISQLPQHLAQMEQYASDMQDKARSSMKNMTTSARNMHRSGHAGLLKGNALEKMFNHGDDGSISLNLNKMTGEYSGVKGRSSSSISQTVPSDFKIISSKGEDITDNIYLLENGYEQVRSYWITHQKNRMKNPNLPPKIYQISDKNYLQIAKDVSKKFGKGDSRVSNFLESAQQMAREYSQGGLESSIEYLAKAIKAKSKKLKENEDYKEFSDGFKGMFSDIKDDGKNSISKFANWAKSSKEKLEKTWKGEKYSQGGYTGAAASNNMPTGLVHANEYVFDAKAVKGVGLKFLSYLRHVGHEKFKEAPGKDDLKEFAINAKDKAGDIYSSASASASGAYSKVSTSASDIANAVVLKLQGTGNEVVDQVERDKQVSFAKEVGKGLLGLGGALVQARFSGFKILGHTGKWLWNKKFGKDKKKSFDFLEHGLWTKDGNEIRLYASGLKTGRYLNGDGNVINKPDDIVGDIYDTQLTNADGKPSLVLAKSEYKKGLYDHKGDMVVKVNTKPARINNAVSGYSGKLLKGAVKKSIKFGLSSAKWYVRITTKPARMFGNLIGWLLKGPKGKEQDPAVLAQLQMQEAQRQEQSTTNEILKDVALNIDKLVNPEKAHNDSDGDGDRDGNAFDKLNEQRNKKKGAVDKVKDKIKEKVKDEKEKGSFLGKLLDSLTSGFGFIKNMIPMAVGGLVKGGIALAGAAVAGMIGKLTIGGILNWLSGKSDDGKQKDKNGEVFDPNDPRADPTSPMYDPEYGQLSLVQKGAGWLNDKWDGMGLMGQAAAGYGAWKLGGLAVKGIGRRIAGKLGIGAAKKGAQVAATKAAQTVGTQVATQAAKQGAGQIMKNGAAALAKRGLVSLAGKVGVSGAAKMAGGQLARTAGMALATKGVAGAAAGLAAIPVAGWVALGVAAIGAGGYMAYKYFKNKKKKDAFITRARMVSYGWDITDEDRVVKLMEVEQILIDGANIQKDGKLVFKQGTDENKIREIFGVNDENPEEVTKYQEFLFKRMLPIFAQHFTAYNKHTNRTDLLAAEENMSYEQMKKMLPDTMVKQKELNPYDVTQSPFAGEDKVDLDREECFEILANITKEVQALVVKGAKNEKQKTISKETKRANEEAEKAAKAGESGGTGKMDILKKAASTALGLTPLGMVAKAGNFLGKLVTGKSSNTGNDASRSSWVSNMWNSGKEAVGKVADTAKNAVSSAASAVASGVSSVFSGGKEAIKKARDNYVAYAKSKGRSDEHIKAMLANMHRETGGFSAVEENMNYSSAARIKEIYGKTINKWGGNVNSLVKNPQALANVVMDDRINNKGLGNTRDGDGYRYRGRGLIQITGRNMYKKVGEKMGIDLENNPDQINDPAIMGKVVDAYMEISGGTSANTLEDVTKKIAPGKYQYNLEKARTHYNSHYKNANLQDFIKGAGGSAVSTTSSASSSGTSSTSTSTSSKSTTASGSKTSIPAPKSTPKPASNTGFSGMGMMARPALSNSLTGGSSPFKAPTPTIGGRTIGATGANRTYSNQQAMANEAVAHKKKEQEKTNQAKKEDKTNAPETTSTNPTTTNTSGGTPWMEIAEKELGVSKHDPKTRDRVTMYFKEGTGTNLNYSYQYCAAFVCWCLIKAGASKGSGNPQAKSFRGYGKEVDKNNPPYGSVIQVNWNGRASDSKNHVAFSGGLDANGKVKMLGGNQRGKNGGDDRTGGVVTWSSVDPKYIIYAGFPEGYDPGKASATDSQTGQNAADGGNTEQTGRTGGLKIKTFFNKMVNGVLKIFKREGSASLPTGANTGVEPKTSSAPAGIVRQATGDSPFNVDKFVSTLSSNAKGGSIGKCAMYVRLALNAAGVEGTGGASAYMYKDWLPSKGFHEISTSTTPQAGDIIVNAAGYNGKSRHGHIQGFTGSQWISDFKQSKPDMRAATMYRHKSLCGNTPVVAGTEKKTEQTGQTTVDDKQKTTATAGGTGIKQRGALDPSGRMIVNFTGIATNANMGSVSRSTDNSKKAPLDAAVRQAHDKAQSDAKAKAGGVGGDAWKNRPGIIKEGSGETTYNVDKMLEHLKNKASTKSTGQATLRVREALNAAGVAGKAGGSAYLYQEWLLSKGFHEISKATPHQAGDIMVNGAKYDGKSKHGHIQVYTGSGWISDHVQSSIVDKLDRYYRHKSLCLGLQVLKPTDPIQEEKGDMGNISTGNTTARTPNAGVSLNTSQAQQKQQAQLKGHPLALLAFTVAEKMGWVKPEVTNALFGEPNSTMNGQTIPGGIPGVVQDIEKNMGYIPKPTLEGDAKGVMHKGKYGFFDKNGKFVVDKTNPTGIGVPFDFTAVNTHDKQGNFIGDKAPHTTYDGKPGKIYNPAFFMTHTTPGVMKNGKYGRYNANGEFIVDKENPTGVGMMINRSEHDANGNFIGDWRKYATSDGSGKGTILDPSTLEQDPKAQKAKKNGKGKGKTGKETKAPTSDAYKKDGTVNWDKVVTGPDGMLYDTKGNIVYPDGIDPVTKIPLSTPNNKPIIAKLEGNKTGTTGQAVAMTPSPGQVGYHQQMPTQPQQQSAQAPMGVLGGLLGGRPTAMSGQSVGYNGGFNPQYSQQNASIQQQYEAAKRAEQMATQQIAQMQAEQQRAAQMQQAATMRYQQDITDSNKVLNEQLRVQSQMLAKLDSIDRHFLAMATGRTNGMGNQNNPNGSNSGYGTGPGYDSSAGKNSPFPGVPQPNTHTKGMMVGKPGKVEPMSMMK